MTLVDLKKTIEKRKYDLIHTLKNNKESICLSRQHQIFGAIKEIENTLRIIDFFHDNEIKEKTDYKFKIEPRQDIMTKMSLKLRR